MKKGFTLVELLAVIAIITLIAALALTSVSRHASKMKNISNTKAEQLIQSSAKTYFYNNPNLKEDIKNNGYGIISYESLKDSGYLNDKLINLDTYEDIDIENSCIYVQYSNYKYVFTVEQPCTHN